MKPTIIAIVGASGSGKSYMSKLLQNELNVYLIVSYTTREMRDGETEGTDHYFVEGSYSFSRTEMLSYSRFSGYEYFALEGQVPPLGVCAYIVDETGLRYLKENKGHRFNIVSIRVDADRETLINRGIAPARIERDKGRELLPPDDYDYIIGNDGSMAEFEEKIRETYTMIRRCLSQK